MRYPLVLLSLLTILGGCTNTRSKTDTAQEIPEAPDGSGKLSGKLDVVAFKGGYGIDFYQKAAEEFQAKNPGLTITLTGNPRVWEQVRPKMIGGNPPDLMFPGWGYDHWAAVEEKQVFALDKALDSPAYDGTGKWRDTFEPSVLKLGQKDGRQYVLPYYVMMQGWWYNPDVFAKNGWVPPKTFDELLSLCGKIKAKGIAPITFQGKYPYYMLDGMILPWVASIGGIKAVEDIQNLVPGAWKNPAVKQAAEMICTLRDKDYFEAGAVGLSHTESQMDFLNGKAAMIPCGTWLYSEMKHVMPAGAKMKFFLPPVVAGGQGDPTAIQIGIEPWMVPTKAKHPNEAIALYKYMTSLPKAKQFVEEKATLMAIKGSDQTALPETLIEPARVFKGSKTVWSYVCRQWYPTMETEVENALTALLNKEATPDKFCERAEAAAEAVRKDTSIAKHKL